MKVIRHQFTDQYVREEDTVMHITYCGEWIDSQDAVSIDILYEEHEIEDCPKCAEIKNKLSD